MKFTQSSISKLTGDGADTIHYDDDLPGLGIRIREGGSRNWIVRYRLGGFERRHTLGAVAVLSLDDARKKARRVLTQVDDGKDPTAEKATKQAASGLLFSAVKQDFLDARKPNLKVRTHTEYTRHLDQHWKPLHKLPVGSINRALVASLLREIAEERGAVAADRARATLSATFAWAIGEGLCETNPVDGTNKASEEQPRDRVLSDAELAAIWNADTQGDYGNIVKLLALTAQRREEIGSLRWSELEGEGEKALIALPAERTKNNRQHDVPLSKVARSILDAVPRRGERDLIFGEGAGGFSGWSKAKAALDEVLGKTVKPWTLHDLRRTAATRMADLGVQPHVIEAALNHVSGHKGGVAGIYNRSTYAAEKRAALDLWAGHIKIIAAQAAGGNVKRLKRA
jgi:integrase